MSSNRGLLYHDNTAISIYQYIVTDVHQFTTDTLFDKTQPVNTICTAVNSINPLQANLNFIRKRSVRKFIQNGGVRKSPDITAATFCTFLECRWWVPWSVVLHKIMDCERFDAKRANMLYVCWRMQRSSTVPGTSYLRGSEVFRSFSAQVFVKVRADICSMTAPLPRTTRADSAEGFTTGLCTSDCIDSR